MSPFRSRTRPTRDLRPAPEGLETRLALSAAPATAAAARDVIAALQAFTQHYPSRLGNASYDPAFDLNHNGQIGQDDGKLLLRRLGPLGPRRPLYLTVSLAPGEQVRGPVPKNSGGVTALRDVTVVGHTTPGALVFTGTGTIDVKLHGPAYVADAHGNFKVPVHLTDGINQFDLQAVDAYGRQNLRAFPIFWTRFAAYESKHPRND